MVLERIQLRLALRSNQPARFRVWLELEEIKEKIRKAVQTRSSDFPDLVFSYLAKALRVKVSCFVGRPWEEVVGIFALLNFSNQPPSHLPLISVQSSTKDRKDPWDYDGRTWHIYSHLLAKHYGWTMEYIASLTVEEALSKVQEILTDEQLEREFEWGMSDKSASYNAKTKTSTFHPLPRPYWMKEKPKPVQATRMSSNALPQGVLNYDAIMEQFRPKAIDPQ